MIHCPTCKATLPDAATRCQFCGAAVAPVGRPIPPASRGAQPAGEFAWATKAYYGVAAFWAVAGLALAALALRPAPDTLPLASAVAAAPGLLTAVAGIGLLLRLEIARGMVNIVCVAQILLFGWSPATTLFAGVVGAPFSLVRVAANIVMVAAAIFMVFLIGATDAGRRDR